MKLRNYIKIQLKIVSSQRTLGNVQIAEEFYYLIREIGLEKLEAKMDIRVNVKGVNVNKGKRNKDKLDVCARPVIGGIHGAIK